MFCPSCGAPAPEGTRFCSYCGGAIPAGGDAGAIPSGGGASPPPMTAPPPPPPVPMAGYPPVPRPKRSRTFVIVVVVVIVGILVVAAVGLYLIASSVPPVQVQNINIYAPDNVCGLNSNLIGFSGYNSSTSASTPLELEMPNYNSTACTIMTMTTNTTGFILSGIQEPLTIPGSGTAGMNVTIQSPGSDFNGNLNLVLT